MTEVVIAFMVTLVAVHATQIWYLDRSEQRDIREQEIELEMLKHAKKEQERATKA